MGSGFGRWRVWCCGDAWASLIGVLEARLAGRGWLTGDASGRRSARRVTQKVGVMQHSASCGTLGRQELVGKVLA